MKNSLSKCFLTRICLFDTIGTVEPSRLLAWEREGDDMIRRLLLFIGFASGVFLVWYYFSNCRAERIKSDLLTEQILLSPTPPPSPERTLEGATQVEGYCVKCKTRRLMQDPQAVTTQADRPAIRGVCPICGSKMFKLGQM